MHEPTDRELSIQGLQRREFDSMSVDGRKVIAERSMRLRKLDDIILGAQLLNAMLDADPGLAGEIKQAIEGTNPGFEKRIGETVTEYLNAGVETGIAEYYKIKYGRNTPVDPTDSRKDAQEIVTPQQKTTPPLKATRPKDEEGPKRTQQYGQATPQGGLERARNIASALGMMDGRSPDIVMRADVDLIDKIIRVVDELRPTGITDDSIIRAIREMMAEDQGVQFPMEALMPERRDDLVRKSRA